MLPKLTFIDIETTGYSSKNDRILEISAIVTEDLEITKVINTIINPHSYLSTWIKNFTNITEDDLHGAPDFYEILPQLQSALQDSIFVAHNADFDYGFVRTAFGELRENFDYPRLCSVKLFRHLYKTKRGSLDTVIDYFGFKCENRHRAYDDAKIILDMFKEIRREHGEERLLEAINLFKQHPLNHGNELSKDLPERCGVYIFYDKENYPLYIGKSKNIRTRVNTHILDAQKSGRKHSMIESASYVHHIETKGEFGALLKEARMIKEHAPIFNKKLRKKKSLALIQINENSNGYLETSFSRSQTLHPEELQSTVGIFVNNVEARKFLERISDENDLCPKLLGLEKYDGKACFKYQLGKCSGACAGKESAQDYNKRFLEAFKKVTYKKWPFDSPVCVIEKNHETYESDIHVIDKWCYLGTFNEYEISGNLEHISSEENLLFDLDIYRLLKSYFDNNRRNDVDIISLDELKQHLGTSY